MDVHARLFPPSFLHSRVSALLHQGDLPVQEFGKDGGQWHQLAYSRKTNAAVQTEPQGDFALCCGMLIPLYAARATEEVFYGPQGVTLGTAQEVTTPLLPPSPMHVELCTCLAKCCTTGAVQMHSMRLTTTCVCSVDQLFRLSFITA